MNNIERLRNAFAIGCRPEQQTSIVDWVKKNVRLATSSRSEYMDLSMTKFLIAPLEAILGNEHSNICLIAPVGSGKTSMLTAAITYVVAEKPGPTLVGMLANADAQELMETVVMPALKACPTVDKLWPTKKNYIRKDQVLFNHMPLWVSGSNITNFQSKSCDYVLLDEAWTLKKSLLKEAARRTHDRFNSKFVLMSQAGIVGDDFHGAIEDCYKNEFCYKCESCNQYHPFEFDDFKFTYDKTEDGRVIWDTLKVWLQCPTCEAVYDDTIQTRRRLSEGGSYLPAASSNPLKGHIAFHYTAFCVWWISWNKLMTEFLQAHELKKAGDYDAIRQFFQKRIAKAFDENEMLLENREITTSEYTLEDAKNIRGDATILTADVQMDNLFYVIRTWYKDGTSKLLSYGTVSDFENLRTLQQSWDIKDKCTGIDSAYRDMEVKEASLKYKWICLNGRMEKDYLIVDHKRHLKYRRIYSEPVKFKTDKGLATVTYYSSNSTKDILFRLKNGMGVSWEIPVDASEDYKNQLNAEVKVFDNGKYFYKKIHPRNHYLDCCCMQIIMALGHNMFPQRSNIIDVNESETSSPPI